MNLGISGRLTRATLTSPLTPLFLVSALAVGLLALFTIPREEEPQISVPMVDIQVAAPGFDAVDAAELVGVPLETIVRSVDGVEHVYTQAQDDGVLVTARFVVGSDPDDAAIRIEEKLRANWSAKPVGVPDPMVTVRGINDVPMLVLTLSPKPDAAGESTDASLHEVATRLRGELAKVEDVGLSFLVGGRPEELRIEPDPARLAAQDLTLGALVDAVSAAQRSLPLGTLRQDGQALAVASGRPLASAAEIEALVLRSAAGAPVYLRDVADVVQGPREDQARAWRWQRAPADAGAAAEGRAQGMADGAWSRAPAVSLAIAKRAGANAVVVAEAVLARLETLRGPLLPAGLDVAVTRNYGETADEKANELLFHLALATASIVALVGFAIGWREAAVTAVVIPTTILLTLFASRLMGYTINRVSLFALIFSIGILVDDAIVMIENIARHWAMRDGRSRVQATIDAVAEVGNPTVVATLTVIAALLPMLFVSGLMGPYMAPIPVNASAAMLFSFFVAVVIAPWLMIRFARGALAVGAVAGGAVITGGSGAHAHDDSGGWLGATYARLAHRVIDRRSSARNFLIGVGIATVAACSLFWFKVVTVKLLPFDDKSEVQVVLDLPEGSSLEETARRLDEAAAVVRALPEAESMEAYAGTAAPFNFNGLVRHYFLRSAPEQGDLMVRLAHRDDRDRASHVIALDLRERLKALSLPAGTSVKVVETPPGPPVMATLLAEIYGPDAQTRRRTAEEVEKLFRSVPYIVDVDNSRGEARPRLRLLPRRDRLEYYGIAERDLKDGIDVLLGGLVIGQAPRGDGRLPLPIRIALPQSARGAMDGLASTPIALSQGLPGAAGARLVPLGELVEAREEAGSLTVFRRDGRAAELVTAELAGEYEAPVYGLLAVNRLVRETDWGALGLVEPQLRMNGQPEDESRPSLLWDGEWEITWVTFRDMGAAFGVALFGIYILVVAQFRSFRLPLVILTPVPLTLVGIALGHLLFGAPFTATSMIGFIALAGIIVRNSILLVDFIRHAQRPDRPLRDVLIEAGRIRIKPIALTAAAAMIGAAVILTDPIFQGLALSLLFGLASSTLLTVLVIPAIYVLLRDDERRGDANLAGHGEADA